MLWMFAPKKIQRTQKLVVYFDYVFENYEFDDKITVDVHIFKVKSYYMSNKFNYYPNLVNYTLVTD